MADAPLHQQQEDINQQHDLAAAPQQQILQQVMQALQAPLQQMIANAVAAAMPGQVAPHLGVPAQAVLIPNQQLAPVQARAFTRDLGTKALIKFNGSETKWPEYKAKIHARALERNFEAIYRESLHDPEIVLITDPAHVNYAAHQEMNHVFMSELQGLEGEATHVLLACPRELRYNSVYVWKALLTRYEANTYATKDRLLQQFFEFKMKRDESLAAMFARFEVLTALMASHHIGQPDAVRVSKIISALPVEYASVASSARSSRATDTYAGVKYHIETEKQ